MLLILAGREVAGQSIRLLKLKVPGARCGRYLRGPCEKSNERCETGIYVAGLMDRCKGV